MTDRKNIRLTFFNMIVPCGTFHFGCACAGKVHVIFFDERVYRISGYATSALRLIQENADIAGAFSWPLGWGGYDPVFDRLSCALLPDLRVYNNTPDGGRFLEKHINIQVFSIS